MTDMLRRAIAEVEKMPADVQDAIAARILAELADEQEWEARLAATTDEQWDRMIEAVRQDIRAGGTESLEDVFPSKSSER